MMTQAENTEQELLRAFDGVAFSSARVQYALSRWQRLRKKGTRGWLKHEKAYNEAVASHDATMVFAHDLARKAARNEPVEDTRIVFVPASQERRKRRPPLHSLAEVVARREHECPGLRIDGDALVWGAITFTRDESGAHCEGLGTYPPDDTAGIVAWVELAIPSLRVMGDMGAETPE